VVIFRGGKWGIDLTPMEVSKKSWATPDFHPAVAGFSIVPSGKQPHNYGKSPFFMGKFTINGHFQ